MSAEENKALVRRLYEELLNKGNLAAADELVSADVVYHLPAGPDMHGLAAYKQVISTVFEGFRFLLHNRRYHCRRRQSCCSLHHGRNAYR